MNWLIKPVAIGVKKLFEWKKGQDRASVDEVAEIDAACPLYSLALDF